MKKIFNQKNYKLEHSINNLNKLLKLKPYEPPSSSIGVYNKT